MAENQLSKKERMKEEICLFLHFGDRTESSSSMGIKLFQPRNLSKNDLGGVIFSCTQETMRECLVGQLFGLPRHHILYVHNIEPGHQPYAWSTNGSEKTKFPAQVCIRTRLQCEPLLEKQFKQIIQTNYHSESRFCFELDTTQASALISLFGSSVLIGELNKGIPKVISNADEALYVKNSTLSISKAIGVSSKWVHKGALTLDTTPVVKDLARLTSVTDFSCLEQSNMDAEILSAIAGIFEQNQLSETHTDVEIENEEQIVYGKERLEDDSAFAGPINKYEQRLEDDSAFAGPINKYEERATSNQSILHQAESKLEIQLFKVRLQLVESRLQLVESRLDPSQKTSSDTHLRSERIFLVGGWDGHTLLSDLDVYSPSTDTLRSREPMSTTRVHAAAAGLVGQIYICGGVSGSTWYDTVESYNPRSDEWTSCPPLSVGKGHLSGVILHGKLFAIGGGNGYHSFSDVEVFDPDLGCWMHSKPMLEKRFAPASATLYGALYTAGGYNGDNYLESVEMADPRDGSWKPIHSMNTRRGCHSLVAFNEKLYAIGGYDGTETVSGMEVLDPRFGSWTNSDPMNLSRAYAGAVVIGDSIYVIGGVKTATDIIDTVECYKDNSGWSLTNLKAIGKRCFFSAAVL